MAGKKHSFWGWLLVSLLGTALHFLYEWSGERLWAAPLSGVNESVWEHMKLLALPVLAWSAAQGRQRISSNFWAVRAVSLLAGLGSIPVVYYTYTGALGISADWFNITIFFLAAGAAYYLEARAFQREASCPIPSGLSFGLILLIGLLFVLFTFYPPGIPLFADPSGK